MKTVIQDFEALSAISPGSLRAYAQTAGWVKSDPYGDHSDVYASDRAGYPEIVLPRTQALGDYAAVVSRLIEIFASAAGLDQLCVYRDLTTADRDVIRIRAINGDTAGTVAISDGVELVHGAYEMMLSAACSIKEPRPVYRAGANKDAVNLMRRVRFGQTEHGSFILTVLTPAISPPIQQTLIPQYDPDDDPEQRLMTKQLARSLAAARRAAELTNTGDTGAFIDAVQEGVSANLCESLLRLMKPFSTLSTTISWALTRPTGTPRAAVRFTDSDMPILEEAARIFRNREPQLNAKVFGFVESLKRKKNEADGTIVFKGDVDGQNRSVTTLLNTSDYERAIQAHKDKTPVVLMGDLEKTGQHWKLLNPRLVNVIATPHTSE